MSVAAVSDRLDRRPARDYPLLLLLVAASAGIQLDSCCAPSLCVWILFLAGAVGSWAMLRRRRRSGAASIAVLIGVGALGGLWHHDRWNLFGVDEVARFAAQHPIPVCLEGTALDTPRYRPAEAPDPLSTTVRKATTRLPIRVQSIRHHHDWLPVSGHALVLIQGQLGRVARGDRLRFVGFLQPVARALNPGEPDYASAARGRRRLCVVICRHVSSVTPLGSQHWVAVTRWPGLARKWAEKTLDRFVPAGQSALAAALLLGTRERLDDKSFETFFTSGSLHILAVSGLHVGILASGFWLLLRLQAWPHPSYLWLVAGFTVTYALVTGLRPPVLRATVLVAVFCLARGLGRHASPWNVLAAAALLTLAICPAGIHQAGTQLSFLAVATMVRAWPWLESLGQPDPLARLIMASRPTVVRLAWTSGRRVAYLMALSTLVWLVTLPLVAARFHMVAPTAIVLNLVLWVPVVVAMFAGLMTLCAAVVAPPVALVTGWICAAALTVVQKMTAGMAAMPGCHWWTAGPPIWWVIGFYLVLAAVSWRDLPWARRWRIAVMAGWLSVGIGCGDACMRGWGAVRPGSLRVAFAAVGHGTSVLIQLPNGRVLLYDAGRMGSVRSAADPISSLLWAYGVTHLDAIMVSHADADHFNAVPALLRRFSVGSVLVTRPMRSSTAPAVQHLFDSIRQAQVPISTIEEGDRLEVDNHVSVQVWHPPAYGCSSEDNANSVVLVLEYRGHRLLLPGDLEGVGLDELLAESSRHCQVIMAPHHGSLNSAPGHLLQWARPHHVIISELPNHRAHAMRSAYAAQGARVLHTAYDGAVRVVVDDHGLRVSGFTTSTAQ